MRRKELHQYSVRNEMTKKEFAKIYLKSTNWYLRLSFILLVTSAVQILMYINFADSKGAIVFSFITILLLIALAISAYYEINRSWNFSFVLFRIDQKLYFECHDKTYLYKSYENKSLGGFVYVIGKSGTGFRDKYFILAKDDTLVNILV